MLKALNVSIRVGNQIINRLIGTVACISFSNEIAAQLGSGENPLLQDSNRNFHTYQAIACSPRRHAASAYEALKKANRLMQSPAIQNRIADLLRQRLANLSAATKLGRDA